MGSGLTYDLGSLVYVLFDFSQLLCKGMIFYQGFLQSADRLTKTGQVTVQMGGKIGKCQPLSLKD